MPGPRDIERFQEELEELFDDLWRVPRFAGLRQGFRPQVDCYRTEDPSELRVVVELPGIEPADIEIHVADGYLLLVGERRRPTPTRGTSYYLMEIDYGPFQRRIQLPEPIDGQKARATYERGLLNIVLPVADRQPRAAPVSIPVKGTA